MALHPPDHSRGLSRSVFCNISLLGLSSRFGKALEYERAQNNDNKLKRLVELIEAHAPGRWTISPMGRACSLFRLKPVVEPGEREREVLSLLLGPFVLEGQLALLAYQTRWFPPLAHGAMSRVSIVARNASNSSGLMKVISWRRRICC